MVRERPAGTADVLIEAARQSAHHDLAEELLVAGLLLLAQPLPVAAEDEAAEQGHVGLGLEQRDQLIEPLALVEVAAMEQGPGARGQILDHGVSSIQRRIGMARANHQE